MVATDTSWYKLQVFHSSLKKYCKRQVPEKYTLCKNYLDACYWYVNPKVHSVLYGIYHSNFVWIAHSIKKLETTGLSLQESTDILKNAIVKLSVI
jgi:hypothetical protein